MNTMSDNYELMYRNIINTARTYLRDNPGLKSMVVGISGGIDSALTTAIASEIIKDLPDVKLIGRAIPIETNKAHEIMRAEKTGNAFCSEFEIKDLTSAYENLYKEIVTDGSRRKDTEKAEKLRRGNIKARIRMIYLFDLAHFNNGMVLSTDNYTELLLGFWTLHGDVGNYGFLQYLWKTEVYGLSDYLVNKYQNENQADKAEALTLCIDAVPTDGLGITESDFDQIGVKDYTAADNILIDYLNGNREQLDHPVIKRHLASEFKRHDPRNISREVIFRSEAE